MKKRILTMMLSLFVAACLFPTISLAAEPTENNVAEINGTKYETLKDAVKKQKKGTQSPYCLMSQKTSNSTKTLRWMVPVSTRYQVCLRYKQVHLPILL